MDGVAIHTSGETTLGSSEDEPTVGYMKSEESVDPLVGRNSESRWMFSLLF